MSKDTEQVGGMGYAWDLPAQGLTGTGSLRTSGGHHMLSDPTTGDFSANDPVASSHPKSLTPPTLVRGMSFMSGNVGLKLRREIKKKLTWFRSNKKRRERKRKDHAKCEDQCVNTK